MWFSLGESHAISLGGVYFETAPTFPGVPCDHHTTSRGFTETWPLLKKNRGVPGCGRFPEGARRKEGLLPGCRGTKLAAMQILRSAPVRLLLSMLVVFLFSQPIIFAAAPAKVHVVALGAVRKVPWTPPGSRACGRKCHGQAGRDADHEGPAVDGRWTAEGMDYR